MSTLIGTKSDVYDLWSELYNNLFSLNYFNNMANSFDIVIDDVHVNSLINRIFWIFITFSFGYFCFSKFFQIFLTSSRIEFYKRKQFIRSLWSIAFNSASFVFLFYYHKFMISPELAASEGRLFPTYDNTIFYKSHLCERFHLYSLLLVTYFMHSAVLDFRENDINEATTKILYTLALIALNAHKYENYFVLLSMNLGMLNIITECLLLFAMQTPSRKLYIYQTFMGLRILSWSHFFVNVLPFKYLVPTLFAKNFKFFLNIFLWLWYGMSIWNSPVLQYFYHQIYHNNPIDCIGEGSASRCILLKDSPEFRHYKNLRKAYMELKLSCSKVNKQPLSTSESASAKAFQTIKCVMTLKRKLRRIREGKESPQDDSTPSSSADNTK